MPVSLVSTVARAHHPVDDGRVAYRHPPFRSPLRIASLLVIPLLALTGPAFAVPQPYTAPPPSAACPFQTDIRYGLFGGYCLDRDRNGHSYIEISPHIVRVGDVITVVWHVWWNFYSTYDNASQDWYPCLGPPWWDCHHQGPSQIRARRADPDAAAAAVEIPATVRFVSLNPQTADNVYPWDIVRGSIPGSVDHYVGRFQVESIGPDDANHWIVVAGGEDPAAEDALAVVAGHVVDDAGDAPDAKPDDGDCRTAKGRCTLRAAIGESNASPGADRIEFTIPGGSAAPTIAIRTSLPEITGELVVDGTTQPVAQQVILDGLRGAVTGLRIAAAHSSVKGLAVRRFAGDGIRVSASDVSISGNDIRDNGRNGVSVAGENTARVNIGRNHIIGNGGLGIDLAGGNEQASFVTANDVDDADNGPNGFQNFPVAVTKLRNGNTTTVTGVLPTADPEQALVNVYASTRVNASGYGEGERWLGQTRPNADGSFRLDLAELIPEPFVSATATGADGSTSEFSPVCGDPDGDGQADSDGDALCDDWEKSGMDWDGDRTVDLPLNEPPFQADPYRKDLYVEIDWMDCHLTTCKTGDNSHHPDPLALRDVINAFAAAPVDKGKGIALHLVGTGGLADEAVPEIEVTQFSSRGPGAYDDFVDIKLGNPAKPCGTRLSDGHFGTPEERASPNCPAILGAKRQVFRYVVFGHYHPVIGSSGVSETGGSGLPGQLGGAGNDLMVTLGNWNSTSPAFGGQRGAEAATFMHELGHTLGLRHGGTASSPNCRPNHLSIMSYALQFVDNDPARPLDYSRQKLPALDEDHLDETLGVQGPAGRRVVFGDGTGGVFLGPAAGPIDWNHDGSKTSTDLSQNLTYQLLPTCQDADLSTLEDYDDWSHLVFAFRASNDFADGAPTAPDEPVIEPTAAEVIAAAEQMDSDGDGVSNAHDNCPGVANALQADSDGDGAGDDCAATGSADLHATIRPGADPAALATPLLFTIGIANAGPDAAPEVDLVTALPPGLTLTSVQPSQGSCEGTAQLTCHLGTIAKDDSASITLVTQPQAEGATGLTVWANSTDPHGGDPNPSDNWATALPGIAAAGGCPGDASTASIVCQVDALVRTATATAVSGRRQKLVQKQVIRALNASVKQLRRAELEAKPKKILGARRAATKQLTSAKKLALKKQAPGAIRGAVTDQVDQLIAYVTALGSS